MCCLRSDVSEIIHLIIVNSRIGLSPFFVFFVFFVVQSFDPATRRQ